MVLLRENLPLDAFDRDAGFFPMATVVGQGNVVAHDEKPRVCCCFRVQFAVGCARVEIIQVPPNMDAVELHANAVCSKGKYRFFKLIGDMAQAVGPKLSVVDDNSQNPIE